MTGSSQIAKIVLSNAVVRVVGLGDEYSNDPLRSRNNSQNPANAKISRGQLSLAPHFVQKVAEETFCVPQVGQNFIPGWTVVVGRVHIGLGGGWEILARLE